MNRTLPAIIMLLAAIISGATAAYGQTEEIQEPATNAVREMIEEESAIATYDIPEDILTNLNKNPGALKRGGESKKYQGNGAVRKTQGYRIQVFSDGRNPSTLQSRAKARGNAIVARFPKYRGQVYSFSSSPNWYTRIGNFKSSQEAAAALEELKRAFPSFAAEMRVVKSPITIIK